MIKYLGIDPGLSGAVALLPDLIVRDTPVARTGTRCEYVPVAMATLLEELIEGSDEVFVAIERVTPFPRAGVVPMFQLGLGLGVWLGILGALRLPYELVRPQDWKRAMISGRGREKEASRLRALEIWPQLAPELERKMDHDRADALLIALWRKRQDLSTTR